MRLEMHPTAYVGRFLHVRATMAPRHARPCLPPTDVHSWSLWYPETTPRCPRASTAVRAVGRHCRLAPMTGMFHGQSSVFNCTSKAHQVSKTSSESSASRRASLESIFLFFRLIHD